ncbi:MAG TPA: thiamine pyrophosphate-binding protein [Dongiaceae bacterium]
MTAAELIVSAMQAEGVSAAFGLVGTHVVEIYEALRQAPDIRHVTSKHEGNATLMADAYSRLSGKISVCFSTAGPGLLNSLAGIGRAYASNSPTIHISGSLPLGAPRRSLHALDREDYTVKTLAHLTKLSVRPGTLDELAAVLPRCFAAAKDAEPGPVHIEIPWDLMIARPGRVPAYRPRVQKIAKVGAMPASLVRKLRAARRPLFCIDALCIRNGLLDDVIALAESHGAMMVVSYDALGAVPSAHPLNAGALSDFYFGAAALDAIGQADFIIGFGVLAKSESERLIRQHAKVRPILADGGNYEAGASRVRLLRLSPSWAARAKSPGSRGAAMANGARPS